MSGSRRLIESGAEFQQLAEHLRRTGAAPSRERLKSEAREVRKARTGDDGNWQASWARCPRPIVGGLDC